MRIGVLKELSVGERRVAIVPAAVGPLSKSGMDIMIQTGSGDSAGFSDEAFREAGASICESREEILRQSDVTLQVRCLGANPAGGKNDLEMAHARQVWIGMMDPLWAPEPTQDAANRGITSFALELLPRITRAQSMDVLSSQANLAGYKAVLLAANALSKLFPMMMTAAGTITPSRVLVVGAGVAGLQAIATARRLGAVVSAYDVRPAVKEQVESLGARFVELDLESAEATGGYAKVMDEAFYKRQAELLGSVVGESDVVITTAAVPGARAPILITAEMVERMRPGSVIVDISAERGGNCEMTRPGETVQHHGVTVMGSLNLPSSLAHHASQLYSKNVTSFLQHLLKEDAISIDLEDEITRETLVTWNGEVVHPKVRERLGLPEPTPAKVDEPALPQ